MKARLAQIAPKLGRLDDNVERHREIIAGAAVDGVDLLILPELSLTGYLLRDHVPHVALRPAELQARLAGSAGSMAESGRPLEVVLGFVELSEGRQCYNSGAHLLFLPGAEAPEILKVYRKVHLPTYGMFDEMRYFVPGRRLQSYETPLLGRTGLLICEDLWFPTCAHVLSVDGPDYEGAQTLLGIANSPARSATDPERYTVANIEVWRRLNRLYAELYGMMVFHVQRVGVEDSYIFTGGSEIVAPDGKPLAEAPLFEEALVDAEFDLDDQLRWHRSVRPMALAEDLDLVRRELERIAGDVYGGGVRG